MCPLFRVKFQVEEFQLSDDAEISLVQFSKYFQVIDKHVYFGDKVYYKSISRDV